MDNNKKVNFIHINHKNRIDYFSEEKLVEFKMNLYTKLANMQEKDFSHNLNSFIEKFLFPDFKNDQLDLNYLLAKRFYDNIPNSKFDRKCNEMLFIIDKILNQNFNMEFKCNEIFVSFISRILFFCFKEIKSNHSKYYTNIKNFGDFKNKISDVIYEDIQLKDYVIITKEDNKCSYKQSISSGKVVQNFKNLDNIDISLGNINNYTSVKEVKAKENMNNNTMDITINDNNEIKKLNNGENSTNINNNNYKSNSNNNLIYKADIKKKDHLKDIKSQNNSGSVKNSNNTNSYFINTDSKKSSFRSINDSHDTTTKKSTFSSNNNGNINDNILITPNSKFTRENINNEEKTKFIDLKFIENPMTTSSKEMKIENEIKFLSKNIDKKEFENIQKKEIEEEKLNKKLKQEEENIFTPVKIKRRSCQLIKNKYNQNKFGEEIFPNKKNTNTLIEKKNKMDNKNDLNQNKEKNNNLKKIEKKVIEKKSSKNLFFGGFFSNNRKLSNMTNNTDNSNNTTLNKNTIYFPNPSDFFKTNFPNIVNSSRGFNLDYKSESIFHIHGLPIYLILLVQKLMSIKKLTITIPKNLKNNNNNNIIENYFIILHNLDWLFQNLLEIEIDFGIGTKSEFDKLLKIKPNEDELINDESFGYSYGKKFIKLVEEFKPSFELLFLVCILCAKFTNLYILTLNNYSCYYFELDYFTKTHYKEMQFIHILDLFNNYINLIKLNVNFNALDSFTFERIINIIQMNNNLKCLNFDFRIDGEDFSFESLKRIYLKHYLFSSCQNIYNQVGALIEKPEFTKNVFDNNFNENTNNGTYSYLHNLYQTGFGFLKKNSNESVDIIKTDDRNLYKSFNADNNNNFNNYSNRNSLNFNFDNPSVIQDNINNFNINSNRNSNFYSYTSDFSSQNKANYPSDVQNILQFLSSEDINENKLMNLIMRKFEPMLEELFFIIESKKSLMELNFNINLPNLISSNENFIMTLQKFIFNIFKSIDSPDSNLKTLKIKSPYFSFNNRKYPVIEKFINTIDLQKNNISINNFTLDIQFNKVPNITNLIPKNVQFLSLGEFDVETFIFFKKNFIEKNLFFLNSQINCLTISFNCSILDKSVLINEFKYLYNCSKPKNLKEIQILTNLIVDRISLNEILILIKADDVEKYYFEFNKQSLENFVYFRSNLQKINLVDDKDNVDEKKLNYFFNFLKKYRRNIDSNMSRKIIYNIIKYVKKIHVTNIEIKFRE